MSESTHTIHLIDVFAEQQLAGNQLAVVEGAGDLSDATMQAVALETNFSETTFITRTEPGRGAVRIFTPTAELPFAGHPTIGTAWVLSGGQGRVVLELGIGDVEVVFEDGIGRFEVPPVEFQGEADKSLAAQLLGLQEKDLAADLPVEFVQIGPSFILIPVKDAKALSNIRIDEATFNSALSDSRSIPSVFAFCPSEGTTDYSSRMFFNAGGLREDPATGSANSAFAAYLRKHLGQLGAVVVDQGVQMGRPSHLYLEVGETLYVGGRVQPVVRGELALNN